MIRKSLLQFALIVSIVAGNSAIGQTPSNPDSALQDILKGLKGTRLSLRDAVQHALTNATSVRKAEAAYFAASGAVRRESGFFDPELFFSMNYQDQKLPTASFFSGAPVLNNIQTLSSTGLRWNLSTGTRFEASLNTIRLATNSAFAFLNPQYTTFGNLSVRQPLLGGFAASARKQLSKAEQDQQASQARYDQEVIATAAEVERRYWDLYAAERDYAVRQLIREQGEVFLRETELRAKAGLVGPNQVANAKTFLAEQKNLLLDREEQLDRLSDQLTAFIGVKPEAGQTRFITVDIPPADVPSEPVDVLVERALQNNLSLQAAHADVEASRSLAKASAWEALPSVDLIGSWGRNGLAGAAQNVIFQGDTLRTTRGGSFSDAINQIGKSDFPTWSLGVEIKLPIGFRKGLGEKDRLEAEVLGAEQRYVEQTRNLEEQVRSAYRELFHGKQRLDAAKEGVEAAQEQVRIGLIEFRNGRTTAFELVRLGADFATAQQRYSEALVRTAKAATTLKQLTSGAFPSTKSN